MSSANPIFMRRAIDLAMQGRGRVEPNPMVGCVIVKDGRVIGEGWHQQYGGPHAEPNALAACTESPEGATAYVTLEPCCHTKKQTPPCVPRLIAAKVGKVIVGTVDPNPQVAGRGVEQLRAAGIEVVSGVLEAECRQLEAPFFASTKHLRPYVTLKWAETADDRIAGPGGARLQISNTRASRTVHELRARCDAILVGLNTVLVDDPVLTARGVETPRRLLRAVLDTELRLPPTSRLVASASEAAPVVVYCDHLRFVEAFDRQEALFARGVAIRPMRNPTVPPSRGVSLYGVVHELLARAVTHLLVEPGPTLARSFLAAGLVDRLWVFRSPKRVGDASAPAAAEVPAHYVVSGEVDLDGDRLTEYLNPASPVFFKAEPSADLRRVAAQRDE